MRGVRDNVAGYRIRNVYDLDLGVIDHVIALGPDGAGGRTR
ncbi:hypothetical protein Sj15T_22620 [Sphingobium sp. TA15]|nr:hypothetical protein [Sphingobium sp. YC-XJ3]WDA38682.1 hypothetical protein PO876_11125 [Sphingobium sp. YC-XJ3]BDD67241.1 hypothetical protein Sj15T_22620 [Sphingobium sp. TA15]